MALGSDGGGSIRIPSAACGIVGIKGSSHVSLKFSMIWTFQYLVRMLYHRVMETCGGETNRCFNYSYQRF